MLPVLIDLKFLKIYTDGIFLVLAFFWGAYLLWRNIRLTAYKEEAIFDGLFLSMAGALLFGRLIYVILNFKDFGFDFFRFLLVNGYPGFSLFGALFGGYLTLYLYSVTQKIKFNELIDYFIAPLFLAMAFGKLGDFFSGGEVGTRTKFILALKYAEYDGARHLTALYEAAFFFIAVFLAQKLLFQIRREKYSKGFLFYCFWWFTAITYFVFDKLKVNRLYFFGQSFNGRVSQLILLTTSAYFLYYFKISIGSRLSAITNFIKSHGSKTVKKIHFRSKKQTGANEKKHH